MNSNNHGASRAAVLYSVFTGFIVGCVLTAQITVEDKPHNNESIQPLTRSTHCQEQNTLTTQTPHPSLVTQTPHPSLALQNQKITSTNSETDYQACIDKLIEFSLADEDELTGNEAVVLRPDKKPYIAQVDGNVVKVIDYYDPEEEIATNKGLISKEELSESVPISFMDHFVISDENSLSDGMSNKIAKRNNILKRFLSEEQDTQWGYDMTYELDHYLSTNEHAYQIEVASVECRVSACLVLVYENSPGAMQYVSTDMQRQSWNKEFSSYSASVMESDEGRIAYALIMEHD